MKTYTDELTPVDSADPVFKIANWYEREVSPFISDKEKLPKQEGDKLSPISLLCLSCAWCMSKST